MPWGFPVCVEVVRAIHSFLSSNKKELVSRATVCQPTTSGGIGFPCFRHRVTVFHGQWVRRFFDDSSSKWKAFFQYFMLELPRDFLGNPYRLRHNTELPPFYQSVIAAWIAIDGGVVPRRTGSFYNRADSPTPLSALSVKGAYQLLIQMNSPPPHCVAKFTPVYPDVVWPDAWQQVHCCAIDRQVTDLAWKVAHGVLYTAARLSSFGWTTVVLTCFCGHPCEDIPHLFFGCPLIQSALTWVSSVVHQGLPDAPDLTERRVLYGFTHQERVPPIYTYMVHVAKYVIWLQRNDFRFRNVRPCAATAIASIQGRLRFILPIAFKRCTSGSGRRQFERKWGANGAVGRLTGSEFVITVSLFIFRLFNVTWVTGL
jgi:hypothetical protein